MLPDDCIHGRRRPRRPILIVALAASLGLLLGAGSAGAAVISPDITTDELDNSNVPPADNGCSLREAVRIANIDVDIEPDCDVAGPLGEDTIALGPGTYVLSLAGSADDLSLTGDLDTTDADGLTIGGAGSGATTIDGGGIDRTLDAQGGLVQISGVTITGGAAPINGDGGGIRVRFTGNLALSDSVIESNTATADNIGDGGGIAFDVSHSDMATIERTRIISNQAGPLGMGGGIFASPSGDPTIEISDSDVSMNSALRGGGVRNSAEMTVVRTRIRDNDAEETTVDGVPSGGGIDNAANGETLRVLDSAIAGNTVTSVDVGNDLANEQTAGGGLGTSAGAVVLRDSTIAANSLVNTGTMGLQQQFGAGLMNVNGNGVAIVNSTVSGNSAPEVTGQGGGIYAAVATELIASTVAGNQAGSPQGDAVTWSSALGVFEVRASILTGADPGAVCGVMGNPFTSGGYNVALGTSCIGLTGPGDAPNTDPLLGPLADNGGPAVGAPGVTAVAQTHAISGAGPAVDRVPQVACADQLANPLGADQRGFPRPSPINGGCDSGAYELAQAEPATTPGPPSNAFEFGKLKRNKKKGTAFLFVNLPGPGEVGLEGKGIKEIDAAGLARASRFFSGGPAKVKIKPGKGKAAKRLRKRLEAKGKAKLKVLVTFIPTGGTANTRAKKLKLLRR